jgi:hypothetical protein
MFSDSASNLLTILNPNNRPSGITYYPKHLRERGQETKVPTSETIPDWFKRCVDEILEGDIGSCQIEENIAFFAIIKWNNNKVNYINLQALVTTGGTLEDFYCNGSSIKYHYHRLDLDCDSTGELFKEALPHIHTYPNGPPRFSFNYNKTNNIIVEFMEFIYLNYCYDKWLKWAEGVWRRNISRGFEKDTFAVILKAFKENQIIPAIEIYKDDLIALKNTLKKEKEQLFQLNIDSNLLEIINYSL